MKSEQEEVWFLCTYMVSHNRIDNKPQFFFFFFFNNLKANFCLFLATWSTLLQLGPKDLQTQIWCILSNRWSAEGMNTRIGHKFLNTQYKNCSRYIIPWKTNQYHQRDQHGIRGIKRKKKKFKNTYSRKIHGPKKSGNFKTSIYNLTLIQWSINIKFMKIHNYTSQVKKKKRKKKPKIREEKREIELKKKLVQQTSLFVKRSDTKKKKKKKK